MLNLFPKHVRVFSKAQAFLLHQRAFSSVKSNPEPLIQIGVNKKGGDINNVTLLGTVIGLKFFPMQRSADRNWALVFLRSKHLYDATNKAEFLDNTVQAFNVSTTSTRVHVFDYRMVSNLRDTVIGDRLFVSGFLSYYNKSSTPESNTQQAVKHCAVVAQRLVFMGSS